MKRTIFGHKIWPFYDNGMWNDDHFHEMRIICSVVIPLIALLILTVGVASAQIQIERDSSGAAAGSLNDGFGGFSASLRGMLDAIWGIDKFFGNIGCYFQGTFMGWDNVSCVINE